MSKRVKARLKLMGLLEKTDHEDRVELDRRIQLPVFTFFNHPKIKSKR